MSGLLSLEEAAALLKMTPAQLKSMQERGEIFPVRGGAGVQFKREEVERFADEHQIVLADAVSSTPSDSLALGDDELELGASGSLGMSELGSGDEPTGGSSGGSFVTTDSSAFGGDSPSALELADAEEAPHGGSSLALQADDLALAEAAPKKGSGSAVAKSSDDEFALDGGSSDDDASVLSPSDSGVKLNPDDSGLSLEASGLDLAAGGSGLDMSMDPSGGDSDIVPLDDADPYSPSAATQLKSGADFDLESPAGAEFDEESESQVIPVLTDEAAYAEAGDATLLGGFDQDLGGGGGFGFEGAGMGGAAGFGASAPAVQVVTVPVQEKPYSIWNVLGLLLLLMFMTPGLIFMTDLLLNMWDYEGQYTVSTSIVDSIVNALQLGG